MKQAPYTPQTPKKLSSTGSQANTAKSFAGDENRDRNALRRRKPKNLSPNYVLRLNMIDAAAQVLEEIQTFTFPADAMLANYYKRNAHLGQRDRAWMSAIVWHVLRHKRLLAQLAQSGDGPFSRRLAQLALVRMQGMEAVQIHSTEMERTWLNYALNLPIEGMGQAVQYSVPDWLYAALQAAYEPAELKTLLLALLDSAGLV